MFSGVSRRGFFSGVRRQRELEAQGAVFSGPYAILGDTYKAWRYSTEYPTEMPFKRVIQDFGEDPPACIGAHLMSFTGVVFTKAEEAEEIFRHKNKFTTKHEIENMLG